MYAGARGVPYDEWKQDSLSYLQREGARARINGRNDPMWVWNTIPTLFVPNSPVDVWYRHYIASGGPAPVDPYALDGYWAVS